MEHRRPDGSLAQGYYCARCGQPTGMMGHTRCDANPDLVRQLDLANAAKAPGAMVDDPPAPKHNESTWTEAQQFLEPPAVGLFPYRIDQVQLSLAISAKRKADALEWIANALAPPPLGAVQTVGPTGREIEAGVTEGIRRGFNAILPYLRGAIR